MHVKNIAIASPSPHGTVYSVYIQFKIQSIYVEDKSLHSKAADHKWKRLFALTILPFSVYTINNAVKFVEHINGWILLLYR